MSSTFHVFSLPADLIQNITLRSRSSQQTTVDSDKAEQQDLSSQTPPAQGSRACNVCLGATFIDVEEQRAHFRSDWHRYNVKIRLRGGKPTSEVDFAQLMDSTCNGSASWMGPFNAYFQVSRTPYLALALILTALIRTDLMPLEICFRGPKSHPVPLLHPT
jgi:hypothetical protein